MLDRITTNHTFFMREPSHFRYFQDQVLPYLEKTVKDKDLRIWCAACSTGEEPYTLAMIIDQFFLWDKTAWDTKILATDISSKAIFTAKAGIYAKENVCNLPADWRKKYFSKYDEERYKISDKIKNEVIFGRFNLNNEFPFKRKMHVIFCRNVMIYFDTETRTILPKGLRHDRAGASIYLPFREPKPGKTHYRYVMPAVYRKE